MQTFGRVYREVNIFWVRATALKHFTWRHFAPGSPWKRFSGIIQLFINAQSNDLFIDLLVSRTHRTLIWTTAMGCNLACMKIYKTRTSFQQKKAFVIFFQISLSSRERAQPEWKLIKTFQTKPVHFIHYDN